MPKNGFRSLTISAKTYQILENSYKASKHRLATMGINSLSAYTVYFLYRQIQANEIFAQYPPLFTEKILDANQIFITDHNEKDRVVELKIKEDTIFCTKCESTNCAHVGFCCTIPEVLKRMKGKIKL